MGELVVSESPDNVFVYDTVQDDGHRYYVSPIPQKFGFAAGLPAEAIMGELTNGPQSITPENFKQNPLFVRFLAIVIGKHAADSLPKPSVKRMATSLFSISGRQHRTTKCHRRTLLV